MKLYNRYVGRNNFLGSYMHIQESGETPQNYDFWSAMWLLGTLLGRDVIIPRPYAPVYMNWYVVLVANSGITRKSTAVNVAKQLLQDYQDPAVALFDARSSAEGIEHTLAELTALHGGSHLAINVSELVRFLGKEQHTMNVPGLLTDLYDCPSIRSNTTIARGRETMSNVFVSFLSASTPNWLQKAVNPDVIEGGFTSRVLFILSDRRKRRVAWATKPPSNNEQVKMMAHLRESVVEARKVGNINLSKGAMAKYSGWYRHKTESVTPFLAGFESREDSHALRLAACLCINDKEYVIATRHITAAIELIQDIKKSSARMFEGGVRPDDRTLGVNLLIETLLIAGAGGIKRHKITEKVRQYLDAKDITYMLDIMHQLGMVQEFKDEAPGRGRRSITWRATKKLADDVTRLTLFNQLDIT